MVLCIICLNFVGCLDQDFHFQAAVAGAFTICFLAFLSNDSLGWFVL